MELAGLPETSVGFFFTRLRDDTSQVHTVHSRGRCDCVLLPPVCVLVTFLLEMRAYPVHCQASRHPRFLLAALLRHRLQFCVKPPARSRLFVVKLEDFRKWRNRTEPFVEGKQPV